MSSAESSRKLRHFGLLSQQKRVRHIQSISLKNLSTDRALLEDDAPDNVYFVLLRPGDKDGFYSSERVQDIVNPSWNNLDLVNSLQSYCGSLLCVIVQIWGSNANGDRILVEWKVHLRGLIHIGDELAKDSKKFQPDSIVFGLLDSFYTAGDCLPISAIGNNAKFCHALEVEQSMASPTYDVYSVARVHTMQRAIKQSEASFSQAQESIMAKLKAQEDKTTLKAKNENLEFRMSLLQEELANQKLALQQDRKKCSEFREKHLQKKSDSTKRVDQLKNYQRRLEDSMGHLSSTKIHHNDVQGDYYSRRTTLITELAAIYPIDVADNGDHFINGVRLPNAENYAGCDDTQIAIALGHTCQLVLMIAKFLQMPLRYPMVHLGSRSVIRDHITAHLSQKDRDFPLYSKGREKMHFNYAVYLLNRNIVQVRTAVRLQTSDLRATLPNLKDLLEQKWGVKKHSEPSLPNPLETTRDGRHGIHVPSPLARRPLPPKPPQYTESQVNPSFPRSPPPPYEANFTQQRISGAMSENPLNTVVVEASLSHEAGLTSLNREDENGETRDENGETREDENGETREDENGETREVEGHEGGHDNSDEDPLTSDTVNDSEEKTKESAIEDHDRDSGDTNGYRSNKDNSTTAMESDCIGDSEGATAQLVNHSVEHNSSIQSHSHSKSSDSDRTDKIHKVRNHPLEEVEDEIFRDNFQDEMINMSEAALSEAGFSQFGDDLNSRTEALSSRGSFSRFNKAPGNVTG